MPCDLSARGLPVGSHPSSGSSQKALCLPSELPWHPREVTAPPGAFCFHGDVARGQAVISDHFGPRRSFPDCHGASTSRAVSHPIYTFPASLQEPSVSFHTSFLQRPLCLFLPAQSATVRVQFEKACQNIILCLQMCVLYYS